MPNPFTVVLHLLGFMFALFGHLVGISGSRRGPVRDPLGRQGAVVPIRSRR
jgi:hypothetical protein